MALADLGPIPPVTAIADNTGQNTGNLTTVIDAAAWLTRLTRFTVYHMVLENLPLGASAKIVRNTRTFGYFGPATGTGREWWGTLPVSQTDSLYFFWNIASGGQAPILTCWLAYDPLASQT